MKAAEWIDRAKAAKGWDSDYRAAKELGVSRNTVSNYRSKADATMDDDTAVKVATALEIEPEIIIIDQVTERTRSEPARAALAGLLERIAGKVLAGSGGGGAGAKGRLDITSVTQATRCGGDPERSSNGVRIVSNTATRQRKPALSPLQLLARALLPATPATPAAFA